MPPELPTTEYQSIRGGSAFMAMTPCCQLRSGKRARSGFPKEHMHMQHEREVVVLSGVRTAMAAMVAA
jgi:hypothetical protein